MYSLHSHFYEKSIKKKAIEYVNERIEKFDFNLSHVYNWIQLFVFIHNRIRGSHLKFRLLIYFLVGGTSISLTLPIIIFKTK
jgi:hypothetical protein